MRLFIDHRTDYRFSEPQARIVQLLRLTPTSNEGQNIIDWRIDVDCNARLRRARDGFGNETHMLYIDGPIDRVTLSVTGEVLTDDRAGMLSGAVEPLPPMLYLQTTPATRPGAALDDFAEQVKAAGGSALSRAHRLNEALADRMTFDPGRHAGARDAASTFAEGHGACQDLAQVLVAAARAMGLPARYISGHRFSDVEGSKVQEATHAWAEVHVEDYGWIGFDPSTGRCPDDRYVRVAAALDFRGAAPLSGTRTGGGFEELEVGVRVGTSQAVVQ
ncbi:transglutaminase family protein [Sphingomonas solaris]|uniref:Transglutaminase family protein n=1 Tax=Alterirhizorhabdus solaris TaxID=2529389 RepID=A0A558QZ32_9SPHN|nr:transglutaminase family protein [Sphingomonas solaris]TVV72358.1 transglutaminase family protein [Sphingomonas solaris]